MVKKLFFFFFPNKNLLAQYKNQFNFYREQTKEKFNINRNNLQIVPMCLN